MLLILTDVQISDQERLRLLTEYYNYTWKRSRKCIVVVTLTSLIYLALGIMVSSSVEIQSMLVCIAILFPVYFFIMRPRLCARRYLKLVKSSPRFGSLTSIQIDEKAISFQTNIEESGTLTWKSITEMVILKSGIVLFSGKIPQAFIYNSMLNEENRDTLYLLAEQVGVPVIRKFRQKH